jgi:hypothetical protein
MSTAGVVGLAAYSLMPAPASAVQLSSGIPAAADSNVILTKDDKDSGKKSSGGSSGSGTRQFKPQGAGSGTGSGSGSGSSGSSTRQFKKQGAGSGTGSGSDSSTRQFRQQGAGSGTGSGGGSWQRQGRWRQGDRWSSGFWRGGLFIFEPFFIGDPCYDYIRVFDLRRGQWVWAWAYICE